MKKIAVVKNPDDHRTAIIWRSKKASVYIVECTNEKAELVDERKAFGWEDQDGTEAAIALAKALTFAGKHCDVKLQS